MSGYRSHDGQLSERMPIRRSLEQKKVLLNQLKEQQAGLKPWVAATVKEALAKRIGDLEKEIAQAGERARR